MSKNKEDYFIAEEAAALATFGPFGAIAALFGLEEEFPMETNYKYHGWEKPEWKKYGNTVTQVNSGPDWIDLDDADSVNKCNQLAQDSSQGPFDWTISQNGKNCKNGENGDIFVQKSPAATIDTILNALSKIVKSKPIIKETIIANIEDRRNLKNLCGIIFFVFL